MTLDTLDRLDRIRSKIDPHTPRDVDVPPRPGRWHHQRCAARRPLHDVGRRRGGVHRLPCRLWNQIPQCQGHRPRSSTVRTRSSTVRTRSSLVCPKSSPFRPDLDLDLVHSALDLDLNLAVTVGRRVSCSAGSTYRSFQRSLLLACVRALRSHPP